MLVIILNNFIVLYLDVFLFDFFLNENLNIDILYVIFK